MIVALIPVIVVQDAVIAAVAYLVNQLKEVVAERAVALIKCLTVGLVIQAVATAIAATAVADPHSSGESVALTSFFYYSYFGFARMVVSCSTIVIVVNALLAFSAPLDASHPWQ